MTHSHHTTNVTRWDVPVSGSGKTACAEPSSQPYSRFAPPQDSVNFFHLRGLISSTIHLLEGWQVVVITQTLVIIVDAQPQLDHSVNTASKLSWLIQIEARSKEGRVKQQPNQILHCLV